MAETMTIECAICLDDINFNSNNCVKTECGHCFHASCLMKNIAHNGFGCPYCRTEMAEAVEDSDDEEEYEEEEDQVYDDDVLRGFRLFMNSMENEENDPEDILAEEEAEQEEEEAEEEPTPKPTPAFIVEKLVNQGITMEHLVKALLKDHDEYDVEEEEFCRLDDELFGKLRIIISNYQPEP
jgi:hypothetical protein